MKIAIVIVADGTANYERKALLSCWNNLETSEHEISILVMSEGGISQENRASREEWCRKFHADFIIPSNTGVRSTLLNYAKSKSIDLCLILTPGTYIFGPGLVTRVVHFFQRNTNVGMVGFWAINGRGFNDGLLQWFGPPQLIEELNGPFAIQTETMEKLDYIDESGWGIQLAMLDRYSYCLPWPPIFNEIPLADHSPGVKKPEGLVFWMGKGGEERSVTL